MSELRNNSVDELRRALRELEAKLSYIEEVPAEDPYTGWQKQDTDGSAYNDLVVSGSNVRIPAANAPTERTWLTDLKKLHFDDDEYVSFEGMQMPHSYVPGSDFYPHVHFAPTTALSDTETVVWSITYTVASVWSVFPATDTITATFTNNAEARAKLPSAALSGTDIVANTHLIASGATVSGLTGNGVGLSAIMDGKMLRSSAGTYGDEVVFLSADSHIRLNRLGSRQEYTG